MGSHLSPPFTALTFACLIVLIKLNLISECSKKGKEKKETVVIAWFVNSITP